MQFAQAADQSFMQGLTFELEKRIADAARVRKVRTGAILQQSQPRAFASRLTVAIVFEHRVHRQALIPRQEQRNGLSDSNRREDAIGPYDLRPPAGGAIVLLLYRESLLREDPKAPQARTTRHRQNDLTGNAVPPAVVKTSIPMST